MIERKLTLVIVIAAGFAVSCSTLSAGGSIPVSTPQPSGASPLPASQVQQYGIYCPTENPEARRYYNDARSAQELGDVDRAEHYYSQAIELDPQYCDAMDNLGLLLRGQGDVDGAVTWYKKSIAVQPSNKVAHQNLAVAYRILGKADEAMQEYQTLVELDPDDPEGHFGLGSMDLMADRPEAAIPHLQKAEALYRQQSSPYVVDARYYLGNAYFALKDCVRAHDYMQSIYAQKSDDAVVNYVLGACYLAPELKDAELARTFLQRARALGLDVPPEMLQEIPE